MKLNSGGIRIIVTVILLVGIIYLPQPALSQDNIQDLIVNGTFEGGFQEDFGVGYGWGAFSNGNAVTGWSFDDWQAVVVDGNYAQRIEIKDALDLNRYAGIYQTISVIPGKQYKLTINGLIRSTEGDVALSDYGYRMQYAIDYDGDIAWELIPETDWQELPWDEQALSEASDTTYQPNTFATTITASSDKLTLFIRGWKKWLNNGQGVFTLDQISILGPAPTGFQAPIAQESTTSEQPIVAQAAAVDDTNQQTHADNSPASEFSAQVSEHDADTITSPAEQTQTQTQAETQTDEVTAEATVETALQTQDTPTPEIQTSTDPVQEAELPVSGQGQAGFNYVLLIGGLLLLILIVGAVVATLRQTSPR